MLKMFMLALLTTIAGCFNGREIVATPVAAITEYAWLALTASVAGAASFAGCACIAHDRSRGLTFCAACGRWRKRRIRYELPSLVLTEVILVFRDGESNVLCFSTMT